MNSISNLDCGSYNKNPKNICEVCGKKFSKRKLLVRHQISHSDLKAFKCPDCQKLFKSKPSLQRHQIHSHEGIKKHKCNNCSASFAQHVNLLTHIDRLHSSKQHKTRLYSCKNCSCVFTRLNTLNRHKTTRHGQKDNNEQKLLKEHINADDPNQLAQLVVSQLKSLEKEISCHRITLPNEDSLENNEEKHPPEETTSVDVAKTAQTKIFDRLFPNGIVKSIVVQTIKRQHEPLAYVCQYCAKEFKKLYNFIRHLRTHNKERPFTCSNCSKRFSTKSKLQEHFDRMHILDEKTGLLSNNYKCCICSIVFDSIRQLDVHMKSHMLSHTVQYVCISCEAQFKTMTAYSSHKHISDDAALNMLEELIPEPIILSHSTSTPATTVIEKCVCRWCGLRLKDKDALKKHVIHHETIKKFKCSLCGRSYSNKLSLNVHRKLHNTAKSFSCHECMDKNFPTKTQLQRHYLHVHEKIRKVQCVYCPKTFKNTSHCKSHMRTHLKRLLQTEELSQPSSIETPLKTKAFIKSIETTPATTKFVEIEMLPKCSKHDHRNFEINTIEKQVLTFSSLSPKKQQHNCPHCTKHFRKPSDLIRHIRTHTKERPFECVFCKKNFKLKSTLEDHHKVHQNETERERLTCQVCGKLYSSSKSLSVHLRIHTGVLPFKCDLCGKGFRTSGHRLSHMRATKTENGQCKKMDPISDIFV